MNAKSIIYMREKGGKKCGKIPEEDTRRFGGSEEEEEEREGKSKLFLGMRGNPPTVRSRNWREC